ncbi:MAG: HIT family protein [Myxococcales bacterium]|nr:HIT family protein [Myxococcales bacterium]
MRTLSKDEALAALEESRNNVPARYAGCVMCALAEGALSPRLVVHETPHTVCVLDAFAARPGHLLVVARRHLRTLRDVPWEVHADMSRVAWRAARALEGRGAKRVYVAQLGSPVDLPTSYAHAHTHVVPVDEVDERARPAAVFSWSSGVVVYDPGEGEELAHTLALALATEA